MLTQLRDLKFFFQCMLTLAPQLPRRLLPLPLALRQQQERGRYFHLKHELALIFIFIFKLNIFSTNFDKLRN